MEQSINYLWINDGEEASRVISQDFANNIINVANKRPNTAINIWFDRDLLSQSEWFLCTQEICAPQKIKFHDLNDIPFYREHTLLFGTKDQKINLLDGVYPTELPSIWARVDMARILVLQQALNLDETHKAAFYSDMDVVSPPVEDKDITSLMYEYGHVFGTYTVPTNLFTARPRLENQFFGFSRKGMTYLDQLFTMTVDQYNGCQNKCNGWGVLKQFVQRRCTEIGFSDFCYMTVDVKTLPIQESSAEISLKEFIRSVCPSKAISPIPTHQYSS